MANLSLNHRRLAFIFRSFFMMIPTLINRSITRRYTWNQRANIPKIARIIKISMSKMLLLAKLIYVKPTIDKKNIVDIGGKVFL